MAKYAINDTTLAGIADAIRDKEGSTGTIAAKDFAKRIAAMETGSYETYAGPYTAEPDFARQTLQTRGKVMQDDVTVQPIAVASVTNTAGGRTIYIGGVINGDN